MMRMRISGRAVEQGGLLRLGMQNDNRVEVVEFVLDGAPPVGEFIPHLLFRLPGGETGFVALDQRVEDGEIVLVWLVGSQVTRVPGLIEAEVRLSGLEGELWHSEIVGFTVGRSIPVESPQPVAFALRSASPESEPPITIAERKINVPPSLQNIAVQNDRNSETVTIRLPRYFDGHDLAQKQIYLKTVSEQGGRDDIHFAEPVVTPAEIALEWVLRPPQTSFAGKLSLQLYVQGEDFKWETEATTINIIRSLDAEPVIPTNPSVMDGFIERLTALAQEATAGAASSSRDAQAAAASAGAAAASETVAVAAKEVAVEARDAAVAARDEAEAIRDSTEVQIDVRGDVIALKRANETEWKETPPLTGAKGDAATIAVGEVATGLAGTQVTVENRGTEFAAVFDFIIPRGEPGHGLRLLGMYDTMDELAAKHPAGNAGDCYAVGTTESNFVVLWDGEAGGWVNLGPITGPAGESAYQLAVKGGYIGTEAELAKELKMLTEKADRVSGAVAGDFAALDESGNLVDGGVKPGDFVRAAEGMGLSQNSFSDEEKGKLQGIEAGANRFEHPATHPASMIEGLAGVATSGKYADLSGAPEPYVHPETHPASMITGLANVAKTGSYNDLANKPSIPAAYVHPTTAGNKHVPAGGASGQILRWGSAGTAVWGNDNNTTYPIATTSANGLMSAADKTKLNGLAAIPSGLTSGFVRSGQAWGSSIGTQATAEGVGTTAQGFGSHAEGCETIAGVANSSTNDGAHAEGCESRAIAIASHAEGKKSTASGESSHAEGDTTTASGRQSHAEGLSTTASGNQSHAEGWGTTSSGWGSHSEGMETSAKGNGAHASGTNSNANGMCAHACGDYAKAGAYQFSIGRFNNPRTAPTSNSQTGNGSLFIVGNGTGEGSGATNAFRVADNGRCYGAGAWNTSGADYAEFFEWLDGNPHADDRRGLFVTLDGEMIRPANAGDWVLGVVSAAPAVIGDQHDDWQGRFLTDVFGSKIYENDAWVTNPDYDPNTEYVPREDRPEWAAVGLMGKLVVCDDGSCEVNGFCRPGTGGVATAAVTGYRVMRRVDATHVKILVK